MLELFPLEELAKDINKENPLAAETLAKDNSAHLTVAYAHDDSSETFVYSDASDAKGDPNLYHSKRISVLGQHPLHPIRDRQTINKRLLRITSRMKLYSVPKAEFQVHWISIMKFCPENRQRN